MASDPRRPGEDDSPSPVDSPASPDGAVTTAGIAGIERAFLRLTFWQTLLSLAGVFTGIVALYAALTESQAVREQTAASVWPRIQVLLFDNRDATKEGYPLRVQFSNVGVGPALVGHLRLRIGSESVTSWGGVVAMAMDKDSLSGDSFAQETVSRRVIAPGETIDAFRSHSPAIADAVLRLLGERGAVLSYCYCSIFDQCWLHEDTADGLGSRVTDVAACPDFGAESFNPAGR